MRRRHCHYCTCADDTLGVVLALMTPECPVTNESAEEMDNKYSGTLNQNGGGGLEIKEKRRVYSLFCQSFSVNSRYSRPKAVQY